MYMSDSFAVAVIFRTGAAGAGVDERLRAPSRADRRPPLVSVRSSETGAGVRLGGVAKLAFWSGALSEEEDLGPEPGPSFGGASTPNDDKDGKSLGVNAVCSESPGDSLVFRSFLRPLEYRLAAAATECWGPAAGPSSSESRSSSLSVARRGLCASASGCGYSKAAASRSES